MLFKNVYKWNIVDWEGWIGTAWVDPLAGMNMGRSSQLNIKTSEIKVCSWVCMGLLSFVECLNKQHVLNKATSD